MVNSSRLELCEKKQGSGQGSSSLTFGIKRAVSSLARSASLPCDGSAFSPLRRQRPALRLQLCDTSCSGEGMWSRAQKRRQLWEGVHYVVLRSNVLIRWVHCWGVEYAWSSDGRDPEFLDPALEWHRIAHDPLVAETYRSSILIDQIRHRD